MGYVNKTRRRVLRRYQHRQTTYIDNRTLLGYTHEYYATVGKVGSTCLNDMLYTMFANRTNIRVEGIIEHITDQGLEYGWL